VVTHFHAHLAHLCRVDWSANLSRFALATDHWQTNCASDPYVNLLVPPGMLLFGTLLPKIGLALGFREKRFLVEFLERVLPAGRLPDEEPIKTWVSSLE
jgi:hypothetical protein